MRQRYIGIVNWFNVEKGFGSVVANGKVFENFAKDPKALSQSKSTLVELFAHRNDCVRPQFISNYRQGLWICFETVRSRENKGSSCMSVGRFMPPPDELPLCSCASERCNWATGL